MRAAVAGLLVCLMATVGCQSDPENDILKAGSLAVVSIEGGTTLENASDGGYGVLEPGTTVRIGLDSGVYTETKLDVETHVIGKPPQEADPIIKAGPQTYKHPDSSARYRLVNVVVESGSRKGTAGSVTRHHLRPID